MSPASAERSNLASLPSAARLAAAPQRLLFLIGAFNVLAAMAWWTVALIDARWQVFGLPPTPVLAGWMHAFIMQYQVLPPFIFGFLLTVFPKWMGLPDLSKWHYLPVGVGLLCGQVCVLVGLAGYAGLIHAGVVSTLVGWSVGWLILGRLVWQHGGKNWHANSCAAALGLGLAGLVVFAVCLHTGDARLSLASIQLGTFGLLLPIFATISHRMLPFFAGNVVAGYTPWRPLGWLVGLWSAVLGHLSLDLADAYGWLWLADAPLLGLSGLWLWRTWPRGAAPRLLRVLFVAAIWLPVAAAMLVAESVGWATLGGSLLGRAPAHALYVGFFGGLLVAMVTRVTQGHSGRPLAFGRAAMFAFVTIQGVAAVRVAAELVPDGPAWQAAAGLGWLLAFAPWAGRSGWIYLTPRVDGRPG